MKSLLSHRPIHQAVSLAVVAACLAALPAQAQSSDGSSAQGPGMRVRGLVSIALQGGGRELSSFTVYNSYGGTSTQSVHVGGPVDFRGGVDITFAPNWSGQLSIGYSSGGVNADNGKAVFSSIPVEALLHYTLAPGWRVGAGLRFPLDGGSYRESGSAGSTRLDFDGSPTLVAEIEWISAGGFGLKLRGMREEFTEKTTRTKLRGNTWGLAGSYYF